jgi:thymidine phosphorylase
MSKKLAEGIDALVLDVKTGSGAFMKKQEDAACLAELMVETGQRMGKKVVALLTDMDQPLGRKVGNALEVEECVEVLRGQGPDDLRQLCLELCGWMFLLGGVSASKDEGKKQAAEIIASGRGLGKFREMVRQQGGDARVVDEPARLPQARNKTEVLSPRDGFVSAIRCEQVGIASMMLGGGREKKEDSIDPAVGLVLHKKVGERVVRGEPLCAIHYNSETRVAAARQMIEAGYQIADQPPSFAQPLVHGLICGTENEGS